MDRPKLKVADVLRRYGTACREQHAASLSTTQHRVMSAIELCRTAALGSHREHCDQCPYERTGYDSCRNRYCTKRPCLARAQWIEDRQAELLDTQYFHVVFTLPEGLPPSHTKTKNWGTAFSSGPPPKPYAPLPPIPNIWAPRSASSPYCTVGDKTCFFIPISIVLFLAAGSPPGRRSLGLLPLGLLPARARALAPRPPLISGVLAKGLRPPPTAFLFFAPSTSGLCCLLGLSCTPPAGRMGRLWSPLVHLRRLPANPADEHFRKRLWYLGQI